MLFSPDHLLAKLLAPLHMMKEKSNEKNCSIDEPYFPSPFEVRSLLSQLKPIMHSKPNILKISSPVIIVGDIHGQYYDFLEMLLTTGLPPHVNMLFLGDIVDRGYYSIQTICLVFAFMVKYPTRVHIIRGNHESESISRVYGFYQECLQRYGEDSQVYSWFIDIFNLLPLACIINENLFAVHGGLSPSIESVDQIRVLDRFRDVPTEGPFADLLWSDPGENIDSGFSISPRGAGYLFAEDVLSHFLHLNRLDHLTRAHQLAQEGYRIYWNDKMSTVWSAPNYGYRCKNLASVMSVDEDGNRIFIQYKEAPANFRSIPKKKKIDKDEYFK